MVGRASFSTVSAYLDIIIVIFIIIILALLSPKRIDNPQQSKPQSKLEMGKADFELRRTLKPHFVS